MATMENVRTITKEAGADLSAGQFKFVEIAADGQVDLVGSAGGSGIGVLLNKPNAAGVAATIAVDGVVKVIAGTGGLTAGDKVQSDAAGAGITAAASDHVLARAMTTAAAGELAEVLLGSHHILAA